MDSLIAVIAANIVVWLGLGCYLAFLGLRQRQIARRLKQLELLEEDSHE